jgi:hypothetical protein
MTFADEVSRQLPNANKCKLCIYVAGLDSKERADVQAVIANSDYPATAIARALKQRGLTISDSTVQRCRQRHVI